MQAQPSSLATANISSPSSFVTPEFRANWGLGVIRAQDAYAMGYTGKGVTLGIADEPFQFMHPEFANRVQWPSPIPAFPVPGYEVPSHGTHVMGLAAAARNDVGMMGVAFDTRLSGVIAVPAAGYPFPQDWAQELVDAGVSVMNGSFGPPPAPPMFFQDGSYNPNYQVIDFLALSPDQLDAYYESINKLAKADIVMVFAAGNESEVQPIASQIPAGYGMFPLITPDNTRAGALYRVITDESDRADPSSWEFIPLTDPDLANADASEFQGALITVVALDQNNQIASFSNRCGAAAAWCMGAPGVNLLSSVPMSTYGFKSGTSMASPLVAGSAAVLRQAFPYMTARQIIEVLLTSATDLGDSDVYGHGLLNLGRAVRGPVEFGSNPIFAATFDVDTRGYHSVWSNDISGPGGLRKRGAGVLSLAGNNNYTGDTTVVSGTLAVNGSIVLSDLEVLAQGTLAGSGTVGDTLVRGTVSPGNSIGILTVDGDFLQTAGSTYRYEVNGTGESDAIRVTGAAVIEPGAILKVQPLADLELLREYDVLSVSDTLTGNYTVNGPDYLFLGQRVGLSASNNRVLSYQVARNGVQMASYAQTGNQASVAQAIDSQGPGAQPFDSLVSVTSAAGLPAAFQAFSGEIYASNQAILLANNLALSRALNNRIQDSFLANPQMSRQSGIGRVNSDTIAWLDVYGNSERLAGNQNATSVSANGAGMLVGLEHALSPALRLGGVLGWNQTSAEASASKARTNAYQLGVYGAADLGRARLSAGVTQSWYEVDVNRTISAGYGTPAGSGASSSLSGDATQVFADIGLPFSFSANHTVQPFWNVSQTWLRMSSFNETASFAGLKGDASQNASGFSTLGVRLQSDFQASGATWSTSAMIGWQRGWGDLTTTSTLGFQEGGDAFTIRSAPMARDALALEFGIGATVNQSTKVMLVYSGSFGAGTSSQSLQAQMQWKF
ncbi:autotransporter domain-containing protein [Orrella marina]|uniref:autotransporter domain-containing protein n=1 Tax=Orrella marina TaxID=2163011 RepID=UPI00131EF175|nr:autotransporter serine protease [Orrella marina]